jgi:hypothetical protein
MFFTMVTVAVIAPPASAAVNCPPPPLSGSTINDNVVVPANTSCALNGVTVNGNLTVEAGASVTSSGSTINGNVSATNARNVLFLGSRVNGNVTITGLTGGGCTSGLGSDTIAGNVTYSSSASGSGFFEIGGGTCGGTDFASTIRGNVSITDNRGAVYLNGDGAGGGNSIGGNVSVANNTGGGIINYNRISGNCTNNVPAYLATGNMISGNNGGC